MRDMMGCKGAVMEINRKQRKVLVACGAAVVAMLVYPPLQFRGVGGGYGWIFSAESDLAINASQLLVQWLAVGIVGAIAFVLAAGEPAPTAGDASPGIARIMGIAFRNSRHWIWILLAMVVVSVVMAPDAYGAVIGGAGKFGASLIIYAVIYLWHCWIARKGEALTQVERAISWRRVSLAVLALIVVVGAVIGWEFITQRPSGRVVYDDEEVFGANPAKTQSAASSPPWERNWNTVPLADSRPSTPRKPRDLFNEAGIAPPNKMSGNGPFDDLIPNGAQAQPQRPGKFGPDAAPEGAASR